MDNQNMLYKLLQTAATTTKNKQETPKASARECAVALALEM